MSTDSIIVSIKEKSGNAPSPACNDSTVLALISLKRQGKITGRINKEKRTWEWSLP